MLKRDLNLPAKGRNQQWLFRMFQAEGYWKWKLIDGVGSTIAESKKLYRTPEGCKQGIKVVQLEILKAESEIE